MPPALRSSGPGTVAARDPAGDRRVGGSSLAWSTLHGTCLWSSPSAAGFSALRWGTISVPPFARWSGSVSRNPVWRSRTRSRTAEIAARRCRHRVTGVPARFWAAERNAAGSRCPARNASASVTPLVQSLRQALRCQEQWLPYVREDFTHG